jgi:hypothetical protein
MRHTALLAALALCGCAATHYDLSVMPRDSGTIYHGTASHLGSAEGPISITIDSKTYTGTWVETQPSSTVGFVSGFGLGRRGHFGSGFITMDNPEGGAAKALLRAGDGSGMRCDLRSGTGRGGGTCRDDRGREYDVQIRPAAAAAK